MDRAPVPLEEEVGQLYQQFTPGLLHYGRGLAQSEEGARDAVQEVFLRYLLARRYGRRIENPRAWLYLVLRNYLFGCFREERIEGELEDPDQLPDPQSSPEIRLYRTAVAREIASSLTGREWECLRLRAEGFGYAEIAGTLGLRIGTVSALLARAQDKMRQLAGDGEASRRGAAEAVCLLFWQKPERGRSVA